MTDPFNENEATLRYDDPSTQRRLNAQGERQAELIAAYDSKIAPVTAFVRLGAAPMLETGKGTVTILPVDYLYWSPPLEALIADSGRGGQMWITGRASTKAAAQLKARGWTLVPKAGGKLGE